MKTRALGFLLVAIGACTYAVGCGSSNNNGGTGGAAGAGTGGKATGGVSGTGGVAGAGAGGKLDSGTDTTTDTSTDTKADTGTDTATDTKADTATDAPADTSNTDAPVGDTSGDTQAAPTFTQVYAILSDTSADTAPNCSSCHDGIIADGGAVQLPHSMDFSTKAAAYTALFGVNSIRCASADAGALKRVLAGSASTSVLWQKVNQFVNTTQLACDGVQMPLQRFVPGDAGTDAAPGTDAGFVPGTHHAITADQVNLIQGWINAGALNN